MKFELLVAVRYLKAKRKQAVISLITIISIVGVAAGVAALIIALAIETGFREDLQRKLLGAQAHVSLLPRDPAGIEDYLELTKQAEKVGGVVAAAPALYEVVLISSKTQSQGVELKGIIPEFEERVSTFSQTIVQGNLQDFNSDGIVIGQELAKGLGASVGDNLQVLSPRTTVSPFGAMPTTLSFRVVAIFSSGLYDLDSKWAYVPLERAQRLLRSGDVVSTIEVKVAKIDDARIIGQSIVSQLDHHLEFQDWMSLNSSIFQALRLEKVVMFITIGLIVLVAALNIVATLIMMVLEKTRDIAILMSMGATQDQIRRIFILQGVIIGIVGTAIGVTLGQVLSFIADKYKLIRLAPEVYTIAYVPFRAELFDTLAVASVAVLVSFLATLYPSAAASRLHPVEALRYE
jgi:lipoprotein-releasing system permease protein